LKRREGKRKKDIVIKGMEKGLKDSMRGLMELMEKIGIEVRMEKIRE